MSGSTTRLYTRSSWLSDSAPSKSLTSSPTFDHSWSGGVALSRGFGREVDRKSEIGRKKRDGSEDSIVIPRRI